MCGQKGDCKCIYIIADKVGIDLVFRTASRNNLIPVNEFSDFPNKVCCHMMMIQCLKIASEFSSNCQHLILPFFLHSF